MGIDVVDAAGDQAEPAALPEQVDAEAGLEVAVEDDVGEVDAPLSSRMLLLAGREEREHQPFHVRGAESAGSCICRRTPASRIAGGRPTFRCRSEPLCFITIRKSLLASGSLAPISTVGLDRGRHGLALLLARDGRGRIAVGRIDRVSG